MNPRFEQFVGEIEAVLATDVPEVVLLAHVGTAMKELVAVDDWLPAEFSRPHPMFYQQYLLHRDVHNRFSVVSFVWGPGQKTPIHDHTVWGVIGMLRGSEHAQPYQHGPVGLRKAGAIERLLPGDVATVSPSIGDIHQVSNAFDDQVSISIHAYGTDIGKHKRHVFDLTTGASKEFVSGYANAAAIGRGEAA